MESKSEYALRVDPKKLSSSANHENNYFFLFPREKTDVR
jgi:hypothetical protein